MSPLRSTEFAVQFGAQLSAWWLVPALIIAAVTIRALMAKEMTSVDRLTAWSLYALRATAVLLLITLAFRPSLIFREILTYFGRVVVLVDDSASMESVDPGTDPIAALDIARRIDAAGGVSPVSLVNTADQLRDGEARLRRFQSFSAGADRSDDAFWDRAEGDRSAIEGHLDAVEERIEAGVGERTDAVAAHLVAARGLLDQLFAGAEDPGEAAYERCASELLAAADAVSAQQADLDREALATGDGELQALIEGQLSRVRLRTSAAMIDGIRERDDLAIEIETLVGGERMELGEQTIEAADSITPVDILQRVQDVLEENSPFPLAGVVLVSDGRDWGGRPIDDVLRTSARRRVPIHVARAGLAQEPPDIAVVSVSAAPVAIKGRETRVRVVVKVVDDEPGDVTVRLLGEGGVIAEAPAAADQGVEREIEFSFTPEESGWFRYRVVAQARGGEVFPLRNNAGEFALQVRDRPVRVLLVDWKPRWETRFITTVLRRLSYVDLNAITMVVQGDGELARGTGNGAWPIDESTLATYDLVVLGDLPQGTLSDGEMDQLQRLVELRGRVLCVIGNGLGQALRSPWNEALLAPPIGATDRDALRGMLLDLSLTQAGRNHPLTAGLGLPVARGLRVEGDHEERGLALAVCDDASRGALWVRSVGSGHTLSVAHPDLWRRLNPTSIDGHAAMVVNMVSWAAMGGIERGAAQSAPTLVVESLAYPSSASVQAWVTPAREGAEVAARSDGEVRAIATSENGADGSPAGRVLLRELPAGTYTFEVDGIAASIPPVHVIDDDPELTWLARDDAFLQSLGDGTGGAVREVQELPRLIERIEPVSRVERRERTWRAWTSGLFVALLSCLLAIEWVWRKFAGLV